jgi:hypothetical protein
MRTALKSKAVRENWDAVQLLLDELDQAGIRLAVRHKDVEEPKLIQVSGPDFDDIVKRKVNRMRKALMDHLLHLQVERETDLEIKVEFWRTCANEDKGYDWSIENWRTAFEEMRFNEMREMYINGEIEAEAVHSAFVRWAKTHKPNYMALMRVSDATVKYNRREVPFSEVVAATDDDNPSLRRVRIPVPQWEPPCDVADEMFEFFNLTPEMLVDHGK